MSESITLEVERRAALVARQSFGKLVALVAARNGDIAGAEDALGEALRQALEIWPLRGIPRNPEAWLLTLARRRRVDEIRHRVVAETAVPELQLRTTAVFDLYSGRDIPDERLKLLFVCAHPAIDEVLRTPLMLQTVLGFEASEVAGLYVTSGPSMAQRLVRTKRKIAEARIPFVLPERDEMAMRLSSVLEAIYGVCAWQWNFTQRRSGSKAPMIDEALYLAELVADMVPDDAETLGLAALVNYLAARNPTHAGYTPLAARAADQWDLARVKHAETLLKLAHTKGSLGRFQLEAAIQSVHASRAYSGEVDLDALCLLHEGLARLAPTIGGAIAQAIVLCQARGAATALVALRRLSPEQVKGYQPYWAALAYILSCQGDITEAIAATDAAIELTSDQSVRDYLLDRRTVLEKRQFPLAPP